MRNLIIFLLVGLLFGCTPTPTDIRIDLGLKDWTAGRAYHLQGKGKEVCSDTYEELIFNNITEKYDTIICIDCSSRYWEHYQTQGSDKKVIWYWDSKSHTWYSFSRVGLYFSYEWVKTTTFKNK